MKTNTMATYLLATVLVVGLSACGKKKNGSVATTPASTCTMSYDGQLRDQYGRLCNGTGTNVNTCPNAQWNGYQWVDISTGQPVNCGYGGGYQYGTPYQGYYGNQYVSGCDQWSYYFGVPYVPVDFGYGQIMCVSVQYLYGMNPGYQQQLYNAYYTQQPMYTCWGGNCGGGYYGGYNYSCSSAFQFGYIGSGWGFNAGLCF